MNKKVVPLIAVLLVLLIGGYLFMRKGAPALAPSPKTVGNSNTPTSLKDLIAKGVAQSCTFGDEVSSGTVYVSGSKMRGDFATTTGSVTTKSHMITMDNTSYIWTDGEKTGIKMSFDPSTQTAGSTAPSSEFDANANMNYKCGIWLTDSAMFVLPTSVTFTTFSVPTAPTGNTSGSSQSSQCSYCDSLTGDSKTQCLSALNCK